MRSATVVTILILLIAISAGCTSVPSAPPGTTTPAATPSAVTTTVQPPATIVRLETSMGNVTLRLYGDMPLTAGNFADLVGKGFYDNTIFHRVIARFMIQGGDPEGTGYGGPGYVIRDEFAGDHRNVRGTIAMANSGPNTGGSQFFINVVDNPHLNGKHPVFGEVVEGMDVVDRISQVQTDENDRPLQNVTIRKASIV